MISLEKINTISILGCGWFGFAFAKKLIALGYEVKGSTTTPEKLNLLKQENIKPYLIKFSVDEIIAEADFFNADVLFICIPPKRNSSELTSYPNKIKSIIQSAENGTKNIVLISSTSVYGDENKHVNELSETNPDTESGKMVLKAEQIIKALQPSNYTIIRFAGLIGPNRNPGKFFGGKTNIPNGLAPVNLIHQTDAVGIACKLIEKQAFGKTYNACNPNHPTKRDFYTEASQKSDLITPQFFPEIKNWKIVESINVPKFLEYEFEVNL